MNSSLLLRLLLALALFSPGAVLAGANPASVQAPLSSMEIVRRLLGLSQRVAAAGSRSEQGLSVCLITPSLNPQKGSQNNAVLLPNPVLVTKKPLNEVQIIVGDQQWRALASSKKAVEGVIHWPLKPLQGGETIQIKFRPKGAAGGEFSMVTFKASSADLLAQNSALITGLGGDEKSWINAIESHSLNAPQLAVALLFSAAAPDTNQIKEMRNLLIKSADCD